jgi:hypothetical protein
MPIASKPKCYTNGYFLLFYLLHCRSYNFNSQQILRAQEEESQCLSLTTVKSSEVTQAFTMIRDVTFNEYCTLPVGSGTSWPYSPDHLITGDIDNDGIDETVLCDRLGNIIVFKVLQVPEVLGLYARTYNTLYLMSAGLLSCSIINACG